MATFKELFPAAASQITCGCDGLAASTTVGRASTVIDNSTNLDEDALIGGVFQTAAGSPSSSKSVSVYVYSEVDATPHYTDGVSGSDAGFTRTDPPNLILLGVVNLIAGATNYYFGQWSVAQAFGGTLPSAWGVVVCNDTGLALGGTANGQTVNKIYYRRVQSQSV